MSFSGSATSKSGRASAAQYVPSGKRGKQRDGGGRFHGAFTGGFSAGYFNTVGSREGWKPRQAADDAPQQKVEDFMDDQDHNEWGGPTSIQQDYEQSDNKKQQRTVDDSIEGWMREVVSEPQHNVGQRLLRALGWREEQSTAYLQQESIVLSKRKLRRVQLQQSRVKLPPPKIDTCGLGFEPFHNAPEFRAYKEQRQRLAQERVKGRSNVYRLSNLLDKSKRGGLGSDDDNDDDDDYQTNAYATYDTIEDFVGKRSVGGFALQEDEDDAYDNDEPLSRAGNKVEQSREKYNNEVYEHHNSSSEDEKDMTKLDNTNNNFVGVLSSWAVGEKGTTTNVSVVASDGRLPLEGFRLGGGSFSGQIQKRYPGPDIPFGYRVERHQFHQDEHPLILKAVSRAVQLEAADQKRQQSLQDALATNASSNAPKKQAAVSPKEPSTTTAFAGLAAAMKNRFTSAGSTQEKKDGDDTTIIRKPTRTILPFKPDRLLCKRFHIAEPKGVATTKTARRTEETFFQTEVMKSVASAKEKGKIHGMAAAATAANLDSPDDNLDDPVAERPSMEVYKSIYQPESEESEAESADEASIENDNQNNETKDSKLDEATSQEKTFAQNNVEPDEESERRIVPYKVDDKKSDRHSKKRKKDDRRTRHSRKKERRTYYDSDESEDSYYRRKRKERRERKRHSRSDAESGRPNSERKSKKREKKDRSDKKSRTSV